MATFISFPLLCIWNVTCEFACGGERRKYQGHVKMVSSRFLPYWKTVTFGVGPCDLLISPAVIKQQIPQTYHRNASDVMRDFYASKAINDILIHRCY